MKTIAASILALAVLAAGCGYGPDHLPALYHQRDHFQAIIDQVLAKMAADKEWWASLSPERRKHWKDYLEKRRFEDRERALDAISSITEGLEGGRAGGGDGGGERLP